MKILILGIPGSGKTTQVDRLARDLGLNAIKMGVILREIAQSESEMGNHVRDIMQKGVLVENKTVAELIKNAVENPENKKGFIMEGYPRTVAQVKLFDPGFDKVFYLEVPIEAAKERLMSRGRADDTAEAIETRLKVQLEDLERLLEHYGVNLVRIDGTRSMDKVSEEIFDEVRRGK